MNCLPIINLWSGCIRGALGALLTLNSIGRQQGCCVVWTGQSRSHKGTQEGEIQTFKLELILVRIH